MSENIMMDEGKFEESVAMFAELERHNVAELIASCDNLLPIRGEVEGSVGKLTGASVRLLVESPEFDEQTVLTVEFRTSLISSDKRTIMSGNFYLFDVSRIACRDKDPSSVETFSGFNVVVDVDKNSYVVDQEVEYAVSDEGDIEIKNSSAKANRWEVATRIPSSKIDDIKELLTKLN